MTIVQRVRLTNLVNQDSNSIRNIPGPNFIANLCQNIKEIEFWYFIMTILWIILLLFVVVVISDEGYYLDTIGEEVSDFYLSQTPISSLQLYVKTSNRYLAGTTDIVYATFIGDFSTSGPHGLVSSLSAGSDITESITLERIIGTLRQIRFEKKGSDGWLPRSVECRLGNVYYLLNVPNIWLDVFNTTQSTLYGDGFETESQEFLPASSNLLFDVMGSYNLYTSTGIRDDS